MKTNIAGELEIPLPSLAELQAPYQDVGFKIEIDNNRSMNDTDSIDGYIDQADLQMNKDYALDANIFPNPNNGTFTIDLMSYDPERRTIMYVFTVDGRLIATQPLNKARTIIGLDNAPNGIYLVKIVSSGQSYTTKLIIND